MDFWGSFIGGRETAETLLSSPEPDAPAPDPGDIDAAALAAALADRLAPILPAQLWASVHAATVHVRSDRGHGVVADIPALIGASGPVAERTARACEQTLDLASEAIAEETTDPWPASATDMWAGAEVIGEEVHLWFGRRWAPFLTLPSIALRDVVPAAASDEASGSS